MYSNKDKQFLKALGARLRDIRNEKGWTLEKTEEYGWPSWKHLQRIESGKNMTVLTLVKISKLYDIPLSELFGEL